MRAPLHVSLSLFSSAVQTHLGGLRQKKKPIGAATYVEWECALRTPTFYFILQQTALLFMASNRNLLEENDACEEIEEKKEECFGWPACQVLRFFLITCCYSTTGVKKG